MLTETLIGNVWRIDLEDNEKKQGGGNLLLIGHLDAIFAYQNPSVITLMKFMANVFVKLEVCGLTSQIESSSELFRRQWRLKIENYQNYRCFLKALTTIIPKDSEMLKIKSLNNLQIESCQLKNWYEKKDRVFFRKKEELKNENNHYLQRPEDFRNLRIILHKTPTNAFLKKSLGSFNLIP